MQDRGMVKLIAETSTFTDKLSILTT